MSIVRDALLGKPHEVEPMAQNDPTIEPSAMTAASATTAPKGERDQEDEPDQDAEKP